ncbi:MAG: hypothetical protein SLAVMIC_00389 [uncultured marine phage]|uniref:Uncharacterized protein n=1 Tax=uncultured marine phage TaxID=707152 RepID=A0A8D9FQ68_9VIRU|nr:MAG: hypothetical protein SLAVMIC_00389 [uncultured marine phage]
MRDLIRYSDHNQIVMETYNRILEDLSQSWKTRNYKGIIKNLERFDELSRKEKIKLRDNRLEKILKK